MCKSNGTGVIVSHNTQDSGDFVSLNFNVSASAVLDPRRNGSASEPKRWIIGLRTVSIESLHFSKSISGRTLLWQDILGLLRRKGRKVQMINLATIKCCVEYLRHFVLTFCDLDEPWHKPEYF